MPIYEFFCDRCTYKFEELCPLTTMTLNCPRCGKESKKLISRFSYTGTTNSPVHETSSGGCSSCRSHNCSSCSG